MKRRRWQIAVVAVAAAVAAGCAPLADQIAQELTGTSTDRQEAVERPPAAPAGPTEALLIDESAPGIRELVDPVERGRAIALIEQVRTAGRGPKTGYERDEFGPRWSDGVETLYGRNGCDTRNDILARDLTERSYRDGTRDCVVVAGHLQDPYSGERLGFVKADAAAVQIDHVIPLSLAWQMGASRWTPERRRLFANDPLNLVAVSGSLNASKRDAGPASWLPPNRKIRCGYVARVAAVALRYDLPLPVADVEISMAQCR